MLSIQRGDLFANAKPPCVIAHGCNAQGKMNSGFAKELRLRYPANFLAYASAHLEEGLKLNDVILHMETTEQGDVHIANLITQEFYGYEAGVKYVSEEAVEQTLRIVKDFALKSSLSVHFPFIGGGLGGGDLHVLLDTFKRVFDDYDATLWINDAVYERLVQSGISV